MRVVSLYKAEEGMILYNDVYNNRRQLLIGAGAKLSKRIITKLMENNIASVYIDDKVSKGITVEPVITQETITKACEGIKNLDFDSIYESASDIVTALSESVDACENAEMLEEYDENTYLHSVNVAIMMVTLGLAMQYKYDKLLNLAIGGLMHDLGKVKIPLEILNKKGKLTDEEMAEMRHHPEYGVEIIGQDITVNASTKAIIREHHENFDGSGYPRQIKGDKIYELARICHVCDVYDALISKRSYKEAFTFKDTIEYIQSQRYVMFDPDVVDAFFMYVPIYKKCTMVELSDGRKAIVMENNRKAMLMPKVRTYDGEVIDLRIRRDLSIVS